MNFITDNPVLLRNTRRLPTIMCVQHSASKHRVEPELLIEADMNGFGNKIGKITNDITSQFDIIADVPLDSIERETLEYRIMCGQKFQQDAIDKAKGIVTIARPSHWFNYRENAPKDGDTMATLHHKKMNETIAVQHKPYFMTYNYNALRREYNEYMRAVRTKCMMQFRMTLDELLALKEPTEEQEKFVRYYKRLLPVTANGHVVNRISEFIENEFSGSPSLAPEPFDASVLKSGNGDEAPYYVRKNLTNIYKAYIKLTRELSADDDAAEIVLKNCIHQCDCVCPNKEQQADYIIDELYKSQGSKKFAWLVCGEWIINNMLSASGGVIRYPVEAKSGECEFWYQGRPYKMQTYNVWGGDSDYSDSYE